MGLSVLVNGKPADSVAVNDRGLAYGDGVFRTLAVRAGRPLNWKHQFASLVRDCATLALPPPDEPTLRAELARVAPGDAVAKVTITRGAPGTRGYAIPAGAEPTRIVAAYPAPARKPSWAAEGMRVRRCALVASDQPRIAGAKTLNRLENVLARSEWRDEFDEGLIADARGNLVGGTMTNVFVVTGAGVFTPDLSRSGVLGAQRARVLEILSEMDRPCEVRDVAFEELGDAGEVFLTNSLIGACPVAELAGARWTPGEVTRRVQQRIAAQDAQER